MTDQSPPASADETSERCECSHFWGSHGKLGCTIELGDNGSGSVADTVFCRCDLTAPSGDALDAEVEGLVLLLMAHLNCKHDGGTHGRFTWTCGMVSTAYDALGWEAPHLADALTTTGYLSPAQVAERERAAAEKALLPVRRFTQSAAVTSKANGRGEEERLWLDLLHLLDRKAGGVDE